MSKQNEIIKTVSGMLNEQFTSKDELLVATQDLGWKPVTLNFALNKLIKAGFVTERTNEGIKEFKLIKEYNGDIMEQKTIRTNQYQAKKRNFRREIRELTPEQQEFKDKVLENRDKLFDQKITWIDGSGMTFPLRIAGMGDVTLRCRFFLNDFMESEPQTGALVYIPWHDERISQLFSQIDSILNKENEVQECVNFGMAPAK